MLLVALPSSVLFNDVEVTDVDELDADLVVAADGINSRLREALLPDAPGPVYAGATAWRGVSPGPFDLPITQTPGSGAEFGVLPLGDGRVCWYVLATTPDVIRHDIYELPACPRSCRGGWRCSGMRRTR